MQKKLVLILIAISILAMLAALAASPPPPKSVSLAGVQYLKGQFKVTYHVTGFTKHSELSASVYVDQLRFGMKCKYDNTNHVVCTASQLAAQRGKNAIVWFSGSSFYTKIPKK
jgi:hypothetical protein